MTLGYLARLLIQMLVAYAVVSTVAAAAVWLWARVTHLARHVAPGRRPGLLFAARLTPASLGLLVAGVLVPLAYLAWEPHVEAEYVGRPALLMAAGAAVLLAGGLGRALRATLETRHIHQRLIAAATTPSRPVALPAAVVESAFPIVALVGLAAPRVFVARSVIEACTDAELRAVLAHEHAHARAHDNLRRLALVAAPDVLAWLPAGTALIDAWAHEAELAADAGAARAIPSPLDLASALVKVARLAADRSDPLPASALYRGDAITERVRRLVDEPVAALAPPSHRGRAWVALALVIGVVLMPLLHEWLEAAFRLGA